MGIIGDELVGRNIELSAEFSRYLFEHPDLGDAIPIGSEVVFLPEYDSDLREFNLELGRELEGSGNQVTYISIRELKPKSLSRIEGVSVKVGATG